MIAFARFSSLLFGACFLLLSSQALAEPLWRVDNPLDAQAMPTYSGDKSPFPQKDPPKEIVAKPVEVKQPRLTSREMKAAELLGEIRTLLSQDDVFNPDVQDIEVEGFIDSSKGRKILIDNRWVHEGGDILVAMKASSVLFGLVSELEGIDPNLASVMRSKINNKVSDTGVISLKISKISEDEVMFVDDYGRSHVINFSTQSW